MLVHEIYLDSGKKGAKSTKDNLIHGVVVKDRYKKIGRNSVKFYYFIPDFCSDEEGGFELSENWFKKEEGNQ